MRWRPGSCSIYSRSVDFGSSGVRKRVLTAELVAVLARLFTRYGNRVGAVLHAEGMHEVIPSRNGRRHVLHVLDRIGLVATAREASKSARGKTPISPNCSRSRSR